MNPKFKFSQRLIVVDRKGQDKYASILSIIKKNKSFLYVILLEDGTTEVMEESTLVVTN